VRLNSKITLSGRKRGKGECEEHLLLCNNELVSELMITEGNKQKGQSRIDPALEERDD
jgi:hypothetical protein